MPDDLELERNLSDLAFAALRSKAPGLLDSLVGFQVLDASDDQSQAMGVFGCKLGSGWCFIPVWYTNGNLKCEHLYVKDQDLFLPLQEAWITYLQGRKPFEYGETADMSRKEIFRSTPDFTSWLHTPSRFSKGASVKGHGWSSKNLQPWAEPAAEAFKQLDLATLLTKAAKPRSRKLIDKLAAAAAAGAKPLNLDLAGIVRSDGPFVAVKLAALMRTSEPLVQAVLEHYDLSDLLVRNYSMGALAKSAAYKRATDKAEHCEHQIGKLQPTGDLPWKKDKNELPTVEVVTAEDLQTPGIASGLTDKEKEDALKGKIVIKDLGTNASKVYHAEAGKSLSNPEATGIYSMLVSGSEFEDILVISAPMTIGAGRAQCVTAVHLEGKHSTNTLNRRLLVKPTPTSPMDWMRFFGKQKAAEKMATGKGYVLITPGAKGTIPFKVLHKKANPDGTTEFWVKDDSRTDYRCERGIRAEITHHSKGYISDCCDETPHGYGQKDREPGWYRNGRRIVVTERPTGLQNIGDTLFVGSDVNAFEAKTGYESNFPSCGSLADAEQYIMGTGHVVPLKVYDHGSGEYSVTGEKSASHVSGPSALRLLVCDYGLRGVDAQALLKQAELNRTARVWVALSEVCGLKKQARGSLEGGPGGPTIPEQQFGAQISGVPSSGPMTDFRVATDDLPHPGNRQLYDPDPRTDGMGSSDDLAQRAAATGQKDVFDVGVLGTLIKAVDSDALTDRYLGDLFLGLDRIGRILFLFFSHHEQYRERYGEDDMEELEDSLRNVFKSLGDVVLFLKQRTIEPSPEMNRSQIDLTPAAA